MVGEGHVWSHRPACIRAALQALAMTMVAEDPGPDAMQSFFVCARK
jgi:hypothetical protein